MFPSRDSEGEYLRVGNMITGDLFLASHSTVKNVHLTFTTKLAGKQGTRISPGLREGISRAFSISFIEYSQSMPLLGQKTQEGIHFSVYSRLEEAKHLINAYLKFGVTLRKKIEFNRIPKSQWQIGYQGSQEWNFKVLAAKHIFPIQPSASGKGSQTSAWIAVQYRDGKNGSLEMYLPADEVPEASVELKQHLSEEEESKSTDWLQSNYMHSRMRRSLHGMFIQSPALFP